MSAAALGSAPELTTVKPSYEQRQNFALEKSINKYEMGHIYTDHGFSPMRRDPRLHHSANQLEVSMFRNPPANNANKMRRQNLLVCFSALAFM
jgi:hypothetical protein